MKSKRYQLRILYLVLIMLLSFLGACTAPPSEKPTPPAESITFPMEVTDQAGRMVRLEKMPEKIISLAPSNTEIVYALGLEDRLVGVTEYGDYPEAAKEKPKIGGFSTVDIEKVVEIEPDLILAAHIHKDDVTPQLEKLGLTVLTLEPKTVDEVLEAISLTGRVTGKSEKAAQLVTKLQNRIEAITEKTMALPESQKPRVFFILWHDPLMTVGPETLIHELIGRAGGINIAQNLTDEYPKISLEAVIMADPQVIIAGSHHGTGQEAPFNFALTEERLAGTSARKNNRIYEIDANLTNRPGPRIVDGLEKLAEFIHPELFQEP